MRLRGPLLTLSLPTLHPDSIPLQVAAPTPVSPGEPTSTGPKPERWVNSGGARVHHSRLSVSGAN